MTITYHNEPPELSKQLELTNLILENSELAASIGNFIFDLRTQELYWSRGMHRIYRTDPASFKPTPEAVPPFGVLEEILQRHYQAYASEAAGTEYERELELTTIEGKRIWARMVCHAEMSEGTIIRIVGSVQDITERKKYETALRESERFIHSTLDALSAHLAIVNEHGTIIAVNTAWRQFAEANGVAADEVSVGVNYLSVCDAAVGANAEGAAEFAAGIRAIMAGTQETYTQEYSCHSPSEFRWFIGRVTRFVVNGTPYLVISHENVTDRKKIEEENRRLSHVVEQSPALIIITDLKGRIDYVNPAFTKITGYSAAEVEGESLFILNQTEMSRDEFDRLLTAILGGSTWQDEVHFTRKNGDALWVTAFLSPITGHGGQPTHFAAIAVDITQRKHTEEALLQSNEDLRLLSNHLSTVRETERTMIAREVHDELGQVFTALKMELMTLLRKTAANTPEIPPRAYPIMQMIESGIKSVQQISSSLRPRILDDLGLIPAIEWEVEGFQNRTEIPVKLSLPSEEIAIAKDVSTAVFRIVQESLTNILRHSGATQAAIDLHVDAQELTFSISDNGKGITEAQLNGTHSFGLIGIRERVRMLGGSVEIKNNADGGMSVRATIPVYGY